MSAHRREERRELDQARVRLDPENCPSCPQTSDWDRRACALTCPIDEEQRIDEAFQRPSP